MAFTDPKWFDSEYYMAQKLAQVQKADPAGNWTADSVATAFAANGFVDQKDGSTAALTSPRLVLLKMWPPTSTSMPTSTTMPRLPSISGLKPLLPRRLPPSPK